MEKTKESGFEWLLNKLFTEIKGEEVRLKKIYIDLTYVMLVATMLLFTALLFMYVLRVYNFQYTACGYCVEQLGYSCFKPQFPGI